MITPRLYLVSLVLLGLAIGIPSYITMSRHWPGLIAGFDAKRCSDVTRLTRGVGGVGVLLGGTCIVAGVATFVTPQLRTGIMIGLAAAIIGGSISSIAICNRFMQG